jgi:hypothetical protein
MSTAQGTYRLVCWTGDRVVSVSAPLPRDDALRLFNQCVATGRYTPSEPARAVVIAETEYAKHVSRNAA